MKEEEIRKRSVFNRYLELLSYDIRTFFKDWSRFIPSRCPACDSDKRITEFTKEGFTYVACTECDTLYVNPRPPFLELMRFYTDSPSTHFWVNDFFKPVAEIRREKIFKPRVDFITKWFGDQPLDAIGDIGAGFGLFLEELKKVWPAKRLVAIEPSTEMAAICSGKGLEVIPKAIEDVTEGKRSFDLLTAFELFEHLHEPGCFLRTARELLKPGGYLLLTTLSGHGFDIQTLWERSKSVQPPHHLNFFNPKFMELLLKRCGYEVIEISTPGKLDWDIVEGMILQEGARPGRFWELFARSGEPQAKVALQEWITQNNLSSHLRTIARRPR
ncbi:MAG TPA: class I SAM-dependent methyltransferase [Candidatus Omnitrophota bacterium]|nr:class I SAM-dependent methyltransferase [Candidatus Omnitrophota bacterium]